MAMSNVKTQTSCHVNMISKARWILTKGTWLGQTLFSTLVKWESSLFVTWKCCKEAKRKKFTYRFVWVFSSCYLQSHTRFGNLRSLIIKYESQPRWEKPPFKFRTDANFAKLQFVTRTIAWEWKRKSSLTISWRSLWGSFLRDYLHPQTRFGNF